MNEALWHQFVGQSVEGAYLLRELLGAGSFGGVFRGEHRVAGQLVREVAVKLVAADEQYLAYQLPELVRGTNLSHPHVVRCFSAGQIELNRVPLLYLILEYAPEGSLEDRMKRGLLLAEEVEELAFQIASGLAYLHGERLVHRDVKPGNLLRAGGLWKVSDLGTLRAMGTDSMSRTQLQLGSLLYMPPESFDGTVSPAWDIWSLALVLLRALTGQSPFSASSQASLQVAIMTKEPPIPNHLPELLDRIIRGCLKKDPRQRWTARQVMEAVETQRRQRNEAKLRDLRTAVREHIEAGRLREAEQALEELRRTAPGDPDLPLLESSLARLREKQQRIAELRRKAAEAVMAGDDSRAAALMQELGLESKPSRVTATSAPRDQRPPQRTIPDAEHRPVLFEAEQRKRARQGAEQERQASELAAPPASAAFPRTAFRTLDSPSFLRGFQHPIGAVLAILALLVLAIIFFAISLH